MIFFSTVNIHQGIISTLSDQDVATDPVDNCKDRSKLCQRWAKDDVDFSVRCKSKENGLHRKCRKTCGLCKCSKITTVDSL